MLATAIAEANWPRALELALDAWRASNTPQLANLIDLLGERCTVTPPRRDQHVWWIETASNYDPATITTLCRLANDRAHKNDAQWEDVVARHPNDDPTIARLLAASIVHATKPYTHRDDAYELPRFHRNRLERLSCIARWPPDPRAATLLADWFSEITIRWDFPHDEVTRAYIQILADMLARIDDVRVIPRLVAIEVRPRAPRHLCALHAERARMVRTSIVQRFEQAENAQISRWITELAKPRIETLQPRERDLRPLWLEVAQNPDALAPRMVLADALLDQGDRRGEHIILACSDKEPDQQRAATLFGEHWTTWFGDLAILIDKRNIVLDRGMLFAARIASHAPPWLYTSVGDHRELLTLQSVSFSDTVSELASFVAFLDSLERCPRHIEMNPHLLFQLAKRRPTWPFREITFSLYGQPETLDALVALAPELVTLHAQIFTYTEWLLPQLVELKQRIPTLEKLTLRWWTQFLPEQDAALRQLADVHPFIEVR